MHPVNMALLARVLCYREFSDVEEDGLYAQSLEFHRRSRRNRRRMQVLPAYEFFHVASDL